MHHPHHLHDPADNAAQLAVMRRLATDRPVPDCCQRIALEWAWEIMARWRDIEEDEAANVVEVKVRSLGDWYLWHLYRAAGGRYRPSM